ncbi:hypothetical protein NMY22_g18743 [Coprinellus aureogranulatus]|nr:hypothetical protein NMY22_g18743 [Coprinellus aureogranulatus]
MPKEGSGSSKLLSSGSKAKKSTDSHWVDVLLSDFSSRREFYLESIKSNSAKVLNAHLKGILVSSRQIPLPTAPRGSFIDWAFRILGRVEDEELSVALAMRKALKSLFRKHVRLLARNIFLYKYPERFAILIGFAHIGVDRAEVEYPPRNHWVASSQELFDLWYHYLRNYEQPDGRLKRHPLMLLDREKLNISIPEDLSCCLYDKETKELVFVVIRRFSNHRAILDWASRIVQNAAATRKSIRLEDPGSLLQVAFSAGARSRPAFGVVKNFRVSQPQSERDAANRQISALFAYVWVRAKAVFPPEIIDDFETFYEKYRIPRFDPEWPSSETRSGTIELPSGVGNVKFDDVERGPGGIAKRTHAIRRAVHRERQGHKFALSWMSNRFGMNPKGGHFYLCGYAAESRAAEDTSWSWCPWVWHCTGLSNYDPTFDIPEVPDENHNQQGVAFVSSSRLPKVYLAWAAKSGLSGPEKVSGALEELRKVSGADADEDLFA